MKMNKLDDIFLSRWLNNELSEDELNQFKSSEHYNTYVNIIKGTDKLQAPSYNLNNAFSDLKEKRNKTTISTQIHLLKTDGNGVLRLQ